MATTRMIVRENKRLAMSQRARSKRAAVRNKIKDLTIPMEEKMVLVAKLTAMPRDESPIRIKRRCQSCGRPRAVLQKFKLCRFCLRKAAVRGDVPGLVKSSW